jgi:hypothetical protein
VTSRYHGAVREISKVTRNKRRLRHIHVKKETREESIRKWQNQGEETIKGAITKEFFPSVERRLAMNLHLNPNVTKIITYTD